MLNVFFQKTDHRLQGIVVGDEVEVKGAAHELRYTVGKIKLVCGCRIRTFDVKNQTVQLVGLIDIFPLLDGIRLWNMLVHKSAGIIKILFKVIMDNLVTEVQLSIERLVYNVEPVRLVQA